MLYWTHFCLLCRLWVVMFRFYIVCIKEWLLNLHFPYAVKKSDRNRKIYKRSKRKQERKESERLPPTLSAPEGNICLKALLWEWPVHIVQTEREEAQTFWKLRHKIEWITLFCFFNTLQILHLEKVRDKHMCICIGRMYKDQGSNLEKYVLSEKPPVHTGEPWGKSRTK